MAEGLDERPSRRDRRWWRDPRLLGGVALAAVVVLNIVFI
jgi:hypothetical protein